MPSHCGFGMLRSVVTVTEGGIEGSRIAEKEMTGFNGGPDTGVFNGNAGYGMVACLATATSSTFGLGEPCWNWMNWIDNRCNIIKCNQINRQERSPYARQAPHQNLGFIPPRRLATAYHHYQYGTAQGLRQHPGLSREAPQQQADPGRMWGRTLGGFGSADLSGSGGTLAESRGHPARDPGGIRRRPGIGLVVLCLRPSCLIQR